MRLTQVYVRQYGPLQEDLELDGAINVVRGPNESGKSLLVEALLKQFADGSVPDPMISGSPEGFVELADGDGRYKLDDGDTLPDFCEERYSREIRSEELRNVFVIRSGDLTFHDRDSFYTHITDKLTGRRVEDIDEIRDALVDEGRLTDTTLKISSKAGYHDAGDQLEKAKSLKQDIQEYLDEATDKGLAKAETEYLTARQREDELEGRIETLERAQQERQKQERYRSLVRDKQALEDNLAALQGLPDQSELAELDERIQALSERKGAQSELEDRKSRNSSLAKWSIGGAVGAFGLALALGFPGAGVVSTILFLICAGYFWYRANGISTTISELDVEEQNILSDARAAGLSVESIDEVRNRIVDIEEERDELKTEIQGKKAVIERELEFDSDSFEEAIDKAEAELVEIEDSLDQSIETDYEDDLEEVRDEFERVEARREELEENLRNHKEALRGFRDRAYELDFSVFVGNRLDLEVENLDALGALVGRLDEFISAIEEDAEASQVAIEIFEDIQEEEKQETAELFEEGSRATEIFCEITEDRYETVTYDNEDNQLKVVKSTGEEFTPESLSDGTRDQLYLSIRVALGEELLDGTSGFFIMDDAFLTSDPNRLETQAELVEKLAEDGWQVIYLTSKDDAISVLSSRCENDVIELQPLQ